MLFISLSIKSIWIISFLISVYCPVKIIIPTCFAITFGLLAHVTEIHSVIGWAFITKNHEGELKHTFLWLSVSFNLAFSFTKTATGRSPAGIPGCGRPGGTSRPVSGSTCSSRTTRRPGPARSYPPPETPPSAAPGCPGTPFSLLPYLAPSLSVLVPIRSALPAPP